MIFQLVRFTRRSIGPLSAFVLMACGSVAWGQLLAFPGAEGAARHATGGRGGDVYVVTNLNDSGAGSLRQGVSSASGPRTIVFAVDGTIHLQTDLRINRSNLTIAGQTAPGGGITIADRMVRVQDNSNVILQHMRFRPGDTNASSEPDSLWVRTTNNVMIDHVTASWSIDEVLSVTHGANNITVQWSMITEALHFAGHSNGPNHGYGSLINGGDYTFHHNLYAHNSSRNPRPQSDTLRLDFVNNVLHNPGNRYGYSEANATNDAFQMNFVGNYGIDGPNTTAPSLFNARTTATQIYAEGNYRDSNKNGILDGTPNSAITGTYTNLPSRVDLPEVHTTDARQAYIQVLSRAGASFYRDSVDRRVINSVLNQTGAHLDSQNEVGGWPTLPSKPAPLDSNGDGVPDQWALAQGFDIHTPLHTTYASSGYTYLEKYIHSLTPFAYAPTSTEEVVISTAYGRGADAQVNENDGISSGSNGPMLNARFSNDDRNEYILLKFDLTKIAPGSITDARLDLTAFRDMGGTNQLKVYGLIHDLDGWDWDESTVEFDGAPALNFDGDSTTRGLITDDVVTLGIFNADGLSEGSVVSFDNLNLAVFLNLTGYLEGEDQAGLATLLIEKTNITGGQTRFASKEATHLESSAPGTFDEGTFAPRLVLEATPALGLVNGDFDGDGIVDGHDFLVWQQQFGQPGGLTADDLGVWESAFGVPESVLAASTAVPEPSSALLLLLSVWLAIRRGALRSAVAPRRG